MTAADALQAAVNLLAQAREANDSGNEHMALALASEASGWALVAQAIEAGVPPPDNPLASGPNTVDSR